MCNCNTYFGRKHRCRFCNNSTCLECTKIIYYINKSEINIDMYIKHKILGGLNIKTFVCKHCNNMINGLNKKMTLVSFYSVKDNKKYSKLLYRCLNIIRFRYFTNYTSNIQKLLTSNINICIKDYMLFIHYLKINPLYKHNITIKDIDIIDIIICSKNIELFKQNKQIIINNIKYIVYQLLLSFCWKYRELICDLCNDKDILLIILNALYSMSDLDKMKELYKFVTKRFENIIKQHNLTKFIDFDNIIKTTRTRIYGTKLIHKEKLYNAILGDTYRNTKFDILTLGGASQPLMITTQKSYKEEMIEEHKDYRIIKQYKDNKIVYEPNKIFDNNSIFIYKTEDIRKDYIITTSIEIFKNSIGDNNIISYKTLPISPISGIIEYIPDTITLYDIVKSKNTTLENYIRENNEEMKISDMMDTFIQSTAFYNVIIYLMGMGDRHIENILVHKSGQLIHIDFECIFKDPKGITPTMRITDNIVRFLGERNSKTYKKFVNTCVKYYLLLRKQYKYISVLFSSLSKFDKQYSNTQIQKELLRRFIPHKTDKEAKEHIIHIVNTCETIHHKISDFIHSQYKTINDILK